MVFHEEDRKGLLVGAGLAFSLGWLWFPWLSAAWLPRLTWGNVDSGGGAAFVLLLAISFLGGGIMAVRLAVPKEGEWGGLPSLRRHCRHFCHGTAYASLILILFLRLHGPVAMPASWPYLVFPMVAAAYLFSGLYWIARLMALSCSVAPVAYLAAILFAALAGQAAVYFSPEVQWLLWPQSQLVAWGVAELLVRLEKAKPGIRGRPRKNGTEPPSSPLAAIAQRGGIFPGRIDLWLGLAFALATIGFSAGAAWILGENGLPSPPASSVWVAGLSFCVGASVPALIIRGSLASESQWLLATAFAAFFTLLAALLPATCFPDCTVAFPAVAEGAVSGLALAVFAGTDLAKGTAIRLAWMAGCTGIVSLYGGWVAGEYFADLTLAIAPAVAAGLLLLAPPLWISSKTRKARLAAQTQPPEAPVPEMSGNGGNDGMSPFGTVMLTDEEQKILDLLSQPELNNQDIADRLFISRDTVRYHLKKLYAKTNTSNRSELLQIAGRSSGFRGNKNTMEPAERPPSPRSTN